MMTDIFSTYCRWNRALIAQLSATSYFIEGTKKYHDEFLAPLISAAKIFQKVEAEKLLTRNPLENLDSYYRLLSFNADLLSRYSQGSLNISDRVFRKDLDSFLTAWFATFLNNNEEKLDSFFIEQDENLRRVMKEYPQAIKDIYPEYGFHFEDKPETNFAETERFILRRVDPCEPGVTTDNSLKPVIIIPPFVLGSNILAFLPGEKKSYSHSFANRGIPTYIRTMKDIQNHEAVQTLTLEEDLADTIEFCRKVRDAHGQPVTLNGYCQGGFSSLCNLLTGELDELVDALITCVAPMDGTRSLGLGSFLRNLPDQFNDLDYGTKTLKSGHKVADGNLMGWVYKLKSIENSGPFATFFQDIMMLKRRNGQIPKINKTVAALNYWLQNERSDLPLSVTEMSYRSYNIPVTKDGTLPITIAGKKLNFTALKRKDFKWLLCYGESDDLVEKEVALAPLDWLDVEVTPFPKGHVAIATSWSHPDSTCALDTVFGEQKRRGPVRFHLDLAAELKG